MMLGKWGPGRRKRAALAGSIVVLATAGPALAFQALPTGGQVNSDSTAGINPAQSVSGDDPTNADVVGGALTAGKVNVPWAIFEQEEASARDQVFVRSFASGAWTTRGSGTVGGASSSSPTFPGSLNFDQSQDGEVPAIDFAGAGRTVPWATWYEHTAAFGGHEQVFASRFDNTGDANQGRWIFSGQGRGDGTGTVNVPSLNINTNQDAENPAIAGGTTTAGNNPGPWITWQETDSAPVDGSNQIFVDKPSAPGQTACTGDTPSAQAPVGGFCFQDVGVQRVGTGSVDPSLNVDPTRDGVEPAIAFTGTGDTVPWVVWYEQNTSSAGLNNNEMVFAAKGIADASANGGFEWDVIGGTGSGTLDTTGTNHFGPCAASVTAEEGCSLNKNGTADAEDPRVAAGTMTPGNATVPWVTWDETLNGVNQVFVSRLVATPTPHFELTNNGEPVSEGSNDSTRADITFSGNTPYVTWREDIGGGVEKAFVGHFINASNPTFVLDEGDTALTPTAQADVREPISSSCTANPFNADGATCQGGAVGTPFFLFTQGSSPLSLFADAYVPGTPVTGASSAVTTSTATVAGTVNPQGASTIVAFQFGTTTNYGSQTTAQRLGPDDTTDSFTGSLTGLPAGTLIHYRAVATSDFGTVVGPDETLTTTAATPPPPPPPKPSDGTVKVGKASVSRTTASVRISCSGAPGAICNVTVEITVIETVKGHKVIAVATAAGKKTKKIKKTVIIGRATVSLDEGQSKVVKVSLNGTGKRLLTKHKTLGTKLLSIQTLLDRKTRTAQSQTVTFKAPKKKRHH